MATPSANHAPDVSTPGLAPHAAAVAPMGLSPNSSAYDAQGLPMHSPVPHSAAHATASTPTSTNPSAARSVKRPRPVKSCTECRKRKLKYSAEHDSSALSDASDAEPSDAQRPAKRNCAPVGVQGNNAGSANLGPPFSSARNGDTNGASPLQELASRVDRLENHVLIKSPSAAEMPRLPLSPATIRGLTVKQGALQTRFFGQSSVRVLMNLFDEAKEFLATHADSAEFRDLMSALSRLHKLILDSYKESLTPMTVIIHMPTFMAQYEMYWDGKLQGDTFLPQLLAICATGSRFEAKSKGLRKSIGTEFDGVHIPTACELTEMLLLQAMRMTAARPQVLWTQLGAILRMAMTMGMHRDPSEFEPQIPVFSAEMRRRMCLPCSIREGDFTCKPPSNLDDKELFPEMIQCYAAMTVGIRLKVVHMLNRIDSIRDYNEVLELGAKLELISEDIGYLFPRNNSLSDSEQSKMWRCRVILDMHIRRPLLALYRPFALGSVDAPAQITRAYLTSSMVILQYLDELDPMLAHYQSVSDMYHLVLKRDMLQASLSLCYYIRAGLQSNAGPYSNLKLAALSPEPFDDARSYRAETPALWSPVRLIKTVDKSMDLLMRNVGGGDVKDIVALSVVLASVQTTAHEQKLHEIRRMLTVVLETCMRATNTNPELVHPPLPHPPPPLSINNSHPYLQAQVPGQQPPHYMLHPNAMAAAPTQDEESMIWDLEGLDPSWDLYWDQIMPLWSS
ncbi:Transcription factor lepE like protein [Verticillium longisporum]|uniref:Transcription factor lepE like protein n=1 Tax=Verticillium longisporum TaxID=100787 RepID=A0A8I2ZP60_VERLO|nr:Transcription factor lepE like protein [Verticillium longisporum]